MTFLARVIPPANAALGLNPCTAASGKQYSCAVGSTIDVPDHDALMLAANGWLISQGPKGIMGGVGTTAQRPTTAPGSALLKGTTYVDITLSACIIWNGVNWINEITGAIV